jgi:hypothetical protein
MLLIVYFIILITGTYIIVDVLINIVMDRFKITKERFTNNQWSKRVNQAYRERAILSAVTSKLALRLSYKSGIKKDETDNSDWNNILYIDLPEGQISYHIAPRDLDIFSDLPEYDSVWDGTYNSKDVDFPKKLTVDK